MPQIKQEVAAAIADYQKGTHPGMMNEMNQVKTLFLKEGVTDSFLRACIKGGHQWCLPNANIDDAIVALRQFNFNKNYKDFEDLYNCIYTLLGTIPRVRGRLTLYDIARRIGHLLNNPVYPNEYVYLARGARSGAKYVLSIKRMNNNVYSLPTTCFQKLFPNISSMDIEDILCIYFHEGKLKDILKTNFSNVDCHRKEKNKRGGC